MTASVSSGGHDDGPARLDESLVTCNTCAWCCPARRGWRRRITRWRVRRHFRATGHGQATIHERWSW